MAAIPTVRIEHEDHPGGVVINEHEFDEAKHVKFTLKAVESEESDPDAAVTKGRRERK
jgi:hypothetical protein